MKWADLRPGDTYIDPNRGRWVVVRQENDRTILTFYNKNITSALNEPASTVSFWQVDLSKGQRLVRADVLIEEDPI